MNKKIKLLISLSFAPLVLSSSTFTDVFSNSTKVYVTYEAGIGTFENGKKSLTYSVAKGRKFKDLGKDEKPNDPIPPSSDYTFKYYTFDDKEILLTQPFNENVTISAYYSYKKPESKPQTAAEAETLWKTCPWEQLCSIAEQGFGDADGDGLIGYFGKWKPNKSDFIGLTKKLTYNGVTDYYARVIDVEHDELANGEGAAALTFEFTSLVPGLSYDGFGHNSNVWSTSSLRNYLNSNEFQNLIESGIKDNAKKVVKTTNAGNRAGSNAVDYSEDVFFPLSLKEMGIETYPYQYIDSISATCNRTDLKDGDTVTKDMFTVKAKVGDTETSVEDFDCNPALPYKLQSTDVPSKSFKISYKDKSVNVDAVPVEKIEKSIRVSLIDPTKTFDAGNTIATTDVAVKGVYSDGSTFDIGVGDYTTTPSLPYTFAESDRGIKEFTFKKTDTGKTFKLGINVGLSGLTVTPTLNKYTVGESIEHSNFKVTANYGDSKSIVLTKDQYSTDVSLPYICLNNDVSEGKSVTFSYNGQQSIVVLSVAPALRDITINFNSNKNIQRICGKDANTNKITKDWFEMTAHYSDGSTATIPTSEWTSNYTFPISTNTTTGSYNIEFYYKGLTANASFYMHSGFESMDVAYEPWMKTYKKDEVINLDYVNEMQARYKSDGYWSTETAYIPANNSSVTYSPDIKTGYTVTQADVDAGSVTITATLTDVNGAAISSDFSFNTGTSANNKLFENSSLNKSNGVTNVNTSLNNSLLSNTSNGSPYVVEEEGSTYKYYENLTENQRRKAVKGESSFSTYWARSPETLTYSFAWGISKTGKVGIYNSEYNEYSPIDVREANSVCPCFCIGKVIQNRVAIENNNQSIISSHNPRNILWEEQYNTKLSLNTNRYYDLVQHCEMFDITATDINPANFMVAIGYDYSKVDPSQGYKQIIPLSRQTTLSATNVGYTITSDGASNPTYTLKVSSPEEIYNKLGLQSKNCFAGIYIMANAVIKDSWDTIYTYAKNNQYYLSSSFAPGVTKDISMQLTGETEPKDYTTRLIGIKEDNMSTGATVGMTFELYSPVNLKIGYNTDGSGNAWNSSQYRTALNNITEELKSATINKDFANVMKKTNDGGGATEISENEETIFALSPSEMGISQSDYTAQHYQFTELGARDNSVISNEGKSYSYYSNHSFFMNNLLRYKKSMYDYNDIWLRSPVALNPNNCFYLTNYLANTINYYGQVKSGVYTAEHYACPCFAI